MMFSWWIGAKFTKKEKAAGAILYTPINIHISKFHFTDNKIEVKPLILYSLVIRNMNGSINIEQKKRERENNFKSCNTFLSKITEARFH